MSPLAGFFYVFPASLIWILYDFTASINIPVCAGVN